MRIAIPQHQGLVSGAYELSKSISLHDLDFQNMSVAEGGLHDFPEVSNSFDWMDKNGVQAVVVGTIDPDNADVLADRGIHVFTGAGELEPSETVQQFMQLMLSAMQRHSGGGCCGGHGGQGEGGCCGGHDHGEADDHECCGGKGHDDGSECCGGKGHGEAEGEAHECCGRHKH